MPMLNISLETYKGKNAPYKIVARDTISDEIYDAVPEKAIASIASEYNISNQEAMEMLYQCDDGSELDCTHKYTKFWIEEN